MVLMELAQFDDTNEQGSYQEYCALYKDKDCLKILKVTHFFNLKRNC